MDNTDRFSEFAKQSPKGILVIYFSLLYKLLRGTWLLLIILFRNVSKFSEIVNTFIYMGLALVLLLLLLRAFLLYKNFLFKISDNHFILKQGVFTKVNTSIPFDRIQNINFKQNLVQQFIRVYEVNIETAGSSKAEIVIKALSYEDAEQLKKELSLAEKIPQGELDQIEDKPLLNISPLELFKVSLTENHFKSMLLFFAILIGLYQQLQDAIRGFGDVDDLDTIIFGDGTQAVLGSFILLALFLFVLVLIGFVSSFVMIFVRHFELKVLVKNQTFEISQGLTTKKSIVLKKEKVQNITISTNPLKRKMGISFITFKQAVSGMKGTKKNKMIKIVGCKSSHIEIIKELLFDTKKLETAEKHNSDTYYKTRMYIRSSILLVFINIALYLRIQDLTMLFINIVLLPVFWGLIYLKFKKTFYKYSEDLLLLGKGSIETHLTYLPFFKVQNIKMNQNFFQQRKNVVDLVFQTAAGKLTIPCIQKERAVEIYNYTVYKVESSTESWM